MNMNFANHYANSPDDVKADILDFPDDARDRHRNPRTPRGDLEGVLQLYHAAARDQDGVFVVTAIEPQRSKHSPTPKPHCRKFAIGEVTAMAEDVEGHGQKLNVYFGPALMRKDLKAGKRGKEADITAVLALVLEEDRDKGELVTLPETVTPTFVVESSHNPALNRHFHFLFDAPLSSGEARDLAKLALRKCGGDSGGGDIDHIWRLPATKNFPDWRKIEQRGRPSEPQPVRLIGGSHKLVNAEVLRRSLTSMPDLKPAMAANGHDAHGNAGWTGGGDTDRDAILARLPKYVAAMLSRESRTDRSKHAFDTIMNLLKQGLTDDEALKVTSGAPFARKYDERGDTAAEISRIRGRWIEEGRKIVRSKQSKDCGGANAGVGDPDAGGVLTQDSVALAFVAQHKDELRYCHTTGAWFRWTGYCWAKDETEIAFNWARDMTRAISKTSDNPKELKEMRKANFCAGVEKFAKADRVVAVTSKHWDTDPFLLGTPGGTVDLRTGMLRAAQPSDGITKATAIAPAESADCPLWKAFIDEATGGDGGMIRFLKQWAGYTLTGDTREQSLVFIHGNGENGKGVFVRVLANIMKEYAVTASMDTFTASKHDKHSTDLAMLAGARLVWASETEKGKAWAESRIKTLTGGDPITARFMRQDNFTFLPEFKLTFIGNYKPAIQTLDNAIRRRFNLVPFTLEPKKKDLQLEVKLQAEWPGILRWMIDGCLDWQQHGLVRPDSVSKNTKAYFDEQDTFAQWIADECELEKSTAPTWWCSSSVLYMAWRNYAIAAGEEPETQKTFSSNLQRLYGLERKAKTHGRGFLGIRLSKKTL